MEWDPHGDRRRVFRTPDQKSETDSFTGAHHFSYNSSTFVYSNVHRKYS